MNPRAELRRQIGEGLRRQRWDVMHVEGSYVGGLLDPTGVPALLSVHDAETLRLREFQSCTRSLARVARLRVTEALESRFERLVYPRFDRCLVVNQRDKDVITQIAPGARVQVLPNGVDAEYYAPWDVAAKSCRAVFHGNLSYPPNAEAATHFATAVLPLVRKRQPQATFHIIGSQPTQAVRALAELPGVTLSADVEDVRPLLGAASVYVCGVRYGSGIKNKILEAMALALPVVSYRAAADGIGAADGREIVLVEEPEQFAAAVVELFAERNRAQLLGRAAREFVVERYSWASRARELEEIYEEMIQQRNAAQ
jgi:glycosyltransferase involved in cell wall biosynthesis